MYPNINIGVLHTFFCTFPKVLTWRIFLTIRGSISWWSFPFFLITLMCDLGWSCKEKLDACHSERSKGYRIFFLWFFCNSSILTLASAPYPLRCTLIWWLLEDLSIMEFYWHHAASIEQSVSVLAFYN